MMPASFFSRRFQCFLVEYRYLGFCPNIKRGKGPKDFFAAMQPKIEKP
ncbi:MAG TPA: hypothetical protein VH254_07030 [Candidatus Udaeobacter sp.]|jgi:hypothetical protein|nr:hypothetical protein [Candidatus Udaeobacter sp.]